MVLNIQFMMFYVWVSGNRGHPSYQTIEAGKLSTKLNSLTKPLIECVYSSCEAARICGKWLSIHWIDFWLVKVLASTLRLHSLTTPQCVVWCGWLCECISFDFEGSLERDKLRKRAQQLCPSQGLRVSGWVRAGWSWRNLVDPASSHMLVSKIKPCMSKYKQICTVKLRMAH